MPTPLWSLWDMQTLHAREFANLIFALITAEQAALREKGPLPDSLKEKFKEASAEICRCCKELELPVSWQAAKFFEEVQTYKQLEFAIPHVRNSIFIELNDRKFYGPIGRFNKFFENPELFGTVVFNAFPSANEDIYEAGTCLALERGTACVMHLMRAQEIAVKAFAKSLGIGPQNDWGSYIRLVQNDLDNRLKVGAPRTPEEQFYAEANIQINSLRLAWRNPSMHPVAFYTPERAEEILSHVRSFMSHLATKVSE